MHSRRDFLRSGVAFVGAGALFPSIFRKGLFALSQQSSGGAQADDGRALVVVQMAGGNDGLNTVIPVADGRYYDARAGIAIPQGQALPLSSDTGLHPSMGRMKTLWDEGRVAIVEGVGYPRPNFSHFVSMDIWQTADPTLKLSEGWLGRYFAKSKGALEPPFLGLAIGRTLPMAFETAAVAVPSVESLGAYQFQGDSRAPALNALRFKALSDLFQAERAAGPYGALMAGTLKAASLSIATLQAAHAAYRPAVAYPTGNPLAAALLLVAEAIAANAGVKVCHVSIGGFDTHAGQPEDQARQLGLLSDALYAFYSDLKAHALDSRVVIMTWSEFGRRVRANASSGTDHGTAAPLFFLGTPVKGGLYGQRPDLGKLDNGNLRYTVNFRSVYAAALGWLGAPAGETLGATYEPVAVWA